MRTVAPSESSKQRGLWACSRKLRLKLGWEKEVRQSEEVWVGPSRTDAIQW